MQHKILRNFYQNLILCLITTGAGKSIVSKMHIIDNIVCSDHMPLCIEIECDIVPIYNSTFIKEPRDVCKWNLAGDKEKLSYKILY